MNFPDTLSPNVTTRAGRMLEAGDVRVTVTSKKSGEHITVRFKAFKDTRDEPGKNWMRVPLVEEVADLAREISEEYGESIQAMPENLQDTSPIAEEMRDNADQLDLFANDLEQWAPDDEDDLEEQRESAQGAVNECPL